MHEIGVRKAIGATNRQIMRRFMARSVCAERGRSSDYWRGLAAIAVRLLRVYGSLQPVLVWQNYGVAPLVAWSRWTVYIPAASLP